MFPRITGLMPLFKSGTIASDKCSLPHNEAKITKAKEACAKSIAKGCTSGGCGGGRGRGGKGGCGGDRPILGANGDRMKALRTLSQIKLQQLALRRQMALG
jgi:hypothetical protein